MDHVALDRAGPHDRHLDDEVVELLGPKARQHGHLGPALDLEDAHGVGGLEHGVDGRILFGDVGHVGDAQHIHRPLDRGEHAQRQDIDLHQAESVDVVLVPLDERAIGHGGVADGHGLVEPALGENKAADVLGEVTGKAENLVGQGDGAADLGIVRVQAGLADVVGGNAFAPAAPDGIGESGGDVLGEPQRFADIADGAARAIVDDGRADRRPLAAVAAIDVLHDQFAPLVLEIDVDVRRIVPLPGDVAGEEEVVLGPGRIHRGDAQAEADRRIGRRAAPLAQDALAARPGDDVMHGQEVVGIFQLLDEREFLAKEGADLVGNTRGEAPGGAPPGEIGQMPVGRLARRDRLVGIFVLQLGEIETDPPGDLERALHRRRPGGEQPGHLGRRLQVPLGVGGEDEARLADGAPFTDAGEDILQRPLLGRVIKDIAGGDDRRAGRRAQGVERGQSLEIAGAIGPGRGQPDATPERVGQIGEGGRESLVQAIGRQDDDHLPFAVRMEIGKGEAAFALFRPPLAKAEQAGEPAPGGPVGGVAKDAGLGGIGKFEAAADQDALAEFTALGPGSDDSGQRVAIGDPDRRQAQRLGPGDQIARVGGPRAGS